MTAKVSILKIELTECIENLFLYLSADLRALLPLAKTVSSPSNDFDLKLFQNLVTFVSDLQQDRHKTTIYDYLILIYTLQSKLPFLIDSLLSLKSIPSKILSIKLTAYYNILQALLKDIDARKFNL